MLDSLAKVEDKLTVVLKIFELKMVVLLVMDPWAKLVARQAVVLKL